MCQLQGHIISSANDLREASQWEEGCAEERAEAERFHSTIQECANVEDL